MTHQEITEALNKIAYKLSTPFCYQYYIKCPKGRCQQCGSDDLMLVTGSDGPEYGPEWIVENLISNELTEVNIEEAFEEMMNECYPENTQVGWLSLNVADTIKTMDPISWQLAASEWANNEWESGIFYSFDEGSTLYRSYEIEDFIQKHLS